MFGICQLAAVPPSKPKQKLFGNGSKYLPGFGGAPSTPTPPPPAKKKSSSLGLWLAGGAIVAGVTIALRN
jgi:hypothetical protein